MNCRYDAHLFKPLGAICCIGKLKMSQNEEFKDSSSKRHLFMILAALVAFPLLPMLMGWYTVLA